MAVNASGSATQALPVALAQLLVSSPEALTWKPHLLDKESAWWQHVPFAFWLITVLKPRVFVELGSHNGVSYAAFCEAVLRQDLGTKCFAVDTWIGDQQAGFYSGQAFNDLNELNERHFGEFSRLLRMNFDEACGIFLDGTIDLLHIDGLHTYEAVSHDFETWPPKVSPRGVVVFHDTNVHKSDFGVRQLFREAALDYPAFEFFHGHGLGVLAVGRESPPAVRALCEQISEEDATRVRELFFRIGIHWSETNSMQINLQSKETALRQASAEHERAQAMMTNFSEFLFKSSKASASKAAKTRWVHRSAKYHDVEMIRKSPLFDASWYAESLTDQTPAGIDPAEHYLDVGGKAGYDPSPLFCCAAYMKAVSLTQGETNPLLHFLKYGDLDDLRAALLPLAIQ